MHNGHVLTLFSIATLLMLGSCGHRFTAVKPEGFAAYPEGKTFQAVSHDHVVYRVRFEKNEPQAQFPFWREALIKRMASAGYRIISDTSITLSGKQALLLEAAAPIGETDYSYLIAMTVQDKNILIAEAAGKVELFQKKKEAILKAISAIVIK